LFVRCKMNSGIRIKRTKMVSPCTRHWHIAGGIILGSCFTMLRRCGIRRADAVGTSAGAGARGTRVRVSIVGWIDHSGHIPWLRFRRGFLADVRVASNFLWIRGLPAVLSNLSLLRCFCTMAKCNITMGPR
jgi:hypothetical protein